MNLGRFVRFGSAGAFNTVFGYLVYAAMIYVGLNYLFASLISLTASVLVGYAVTGRLVFRHRGESRLLRYVMAYVAIYFLYVGLLAVLTGAGLNEYLAGLAAVPPMVIVSYTILRLLVFPERAGQAGRSP